MIANSGAYLLFIQLPKSVDLEAGSLGRGHLRRGSYVYCGSGARGLHARALRHLCRADGPPRALYAPLARRLGLGDRPPRPKKLRWHIDYLLELPGAEVLAVTLLPDALVECELAHALQEKLGARAEVKGFGASDCQAGCGAHLLRLSRRRHGAARRLAGGLAPGEVHVLEPT